MRRRRPEETRHGAPRGREYDRGFDRSHRYGSDPGRYGTPFPGAAGYPGARWGWGPVGWAGWGPGMEFWPYADVPGYGFDGTARTPRRRPEESPMYGTGGDRAVQRWARRYGYDLGYEIRPDRGRRSGSDPERYPRERR